MNTYLILTIIAWLIYWTYTTMVFCMFKVPESYSATFYLLNEKKKGLGILFPIMSVLYTFLIWPSWLHISDAILPYMTWLCFISGVGLLLVCASPFFREYNRETLPPTFWNRIKDTLYRHTHGQGLVHMIGALLAMIGVVVWIALTPYWWILLIWLFISIALCVFTKSWKTSITFWFEFLIYNCIACFNLGLLCVGI